MIKLKISGEPQEIASFFQHLADVDPLIVEYTSSISKRAEHHKWGSSIAGISVELVPDIEADVSIYKGKKYMGQAVEGYIYVLPYYGKDGIKGYKIGKTVNPHSRRKTFSVKFPFDIEFIALIKADDISKKETEYHQIFADVRRGSSEWYDLTPGDIDYLKSEMSLDDRKFLEAFNG